MSSSSKEGHLSPSSPATATRDIPEPPPCDKKQSPNIVIDWDGPQDADNPKKSVHNYSQKLGTQPFISLQLAIPT